MAAFGIPTSSNRAAVHASNHSKYRGKYTIAPGSQCPHSTVTVRLFTRMMRSTAGTCSSPSADGNLGFSPAQNVVYAEAQFPERPARRDAMSPRFLAVVGSLLALSAAPAIAHHSFAAEYDNTQPVKVTGTLTKVEWTNPHIWFFLDVK